MPRTTFNQMVTGVAIVNAVETTALTTAPVSSSLDGDSICIEGNLNMLTGATTTAVVIRCRRGVGTAGALVGVAETFTIGAAANFTNSFQFVDSPGSVAGQQYTVTAQQTGGSSNGNVVAIAANVNVGQP